MAVCPFCDAAVSDVECGACGRNPTAPRGPCRKCKRMTPTAETTCCHCGAAAGSELSWKIPLIIGMFVLAIALSVLIQVLAG